MGHSFNHDVLSDWGDKPDDSFWHTWKQCGFWTHDEAAILYHIVHSHAGLWLDIGAHTGWTSAHVVVAGGRVASVEPMLALQEWQARFEQNVNAFWPGIYDVSHMRSYEYAQQTRLLFDGVIVDGDHCDQWPLSDAKCAHNLLRGDGIVLFHDAIGGPVWRGIEYLLDAGYQCKMYRTPHMVACCWRGEWTPPEHTPDPKIDWNEIRTNHMKEFAWQRVSVDAA
jgi:hypothetical protein